MRNESLAPLSEAFVREFVGRQIGAAPEPGTFAERMGVFMQRLAARRMRRRAR